MVLAKLAGAHAEGAVQDGLREVEAARTRADTPALLKGLLFGPDGAAFSPTHTRKGGRLYRYYVSQTVLKHGAGSCPVGRVPAGDIEAAVIDQLRAVFRQPEIVAGTWKAARAHADDISEADARTALQQLDPLWDELFPAEQARIDSFWSDPAAQRNAGSRCAMPAASAGYDLGDAGMPAAVVETAAALVER